MEVHLSIAIDYSKTEVRMLLPHVPQSNKSTGSKSVTRLSQYYTNKKNNINLLAINIGIRISII